MKYEQAIRQAFQDFEENVAASAAVVANETINGRWRDHKVRKNLFDRTLGHLEGDVYLDVDTDVAPYRCRYVVYPSRYEIKSKQSFGRWSKMTLSRQCLHPCGGCLRCLSSRNNKTASGSALIWHHWIKHKKHQTSFYCTQNNKINFRQLPTILNITLPGITGNNENTSIPSYWWCFVRILRFRLITLIHPY